jgi:hypothetical protein
VGGLDLAELVDRKVHDQLAGINGPLEQLVHDAIDRELDRLVHDLVDAELVARSNGATAVVAGPVEEARGEEPPAAAPAGESAAALKRCPTCREEKPLDQFDRDASRPNGHRSRCRACRSLHDRRRANGAKPAEAAQPPPFPVA